MLLHVSRIFAFSVAKQVRRPLMAGLTLERLDYQSYSFTNVRSIRNEIVATIYETFVLFIHLSRY